jgi:Rad3-related DNA helicase
MFGGGFPPLRPFQVSAHEALREGVRQGHTRQLIMAPTGSGKCLGLGTPVIMANGTLKNVEDVKTGDQLMGPDGRVRKECRQNKVVKSHPAELNSSTHLSLGPLRSGVHPFACH